MSQRQSPAYQPPPAFGRGQVSLLDAADRVVCTELPNLHTVGVANLAEVIEHRVNYAANSMSHYLRFRNDGELYYVFNSRGQLVELTARALRFTISSNGDYLFRQP